ncbi:MAG TPA: hypothetical protein VMT50_04230 [Steroidobacteraceae bacterium]|nr:hypothetical protein [Steroidobacteraceae bacterium]
MMIPVRPYFLLTLVLAGAGLLGVGPVRAEDPAPLSASPAAIRDLDYGDALFHFYQDDYFESLVRLEAARDLGKIPHQQGEAELLAGGLYLTLGLHAEATRIFEGLLAKQVPQSVSDRAFFYLARIHFQHGYFDAALRDLRHIQYELPGSLESERRLLVANVLMAQGRFGDAATYLQSWTDKSGWAQYARFNLGVALVRSGSATLGRSFLDSAGLQPATGEEQLALRDRANLALGYTALQEHDSPGAITALRRVRLDGPSSNRALLGLGWAASEAQHPDQALAPWLELRHGRLLDAAVQESYLAVPYAYAKLASNGQAVQEYRLAIKSYAEEVGRIDESIAAIRAGGFVPAVLEVTPRPSDAGWFAQLQKAPDAPQTRYLYQLLASHGFQEGLKSCRDLVMMQRNLNRWRGMIGAYQEMGATRELARGAIGAYAQLRLASLDDGSLERRQAQFEGRAAEIATAGEPGASAEQLRQLNDDLRASDAALQETRRLAASVRRAGETSRHDTAGLAERVGALAGRIDELAPRLDAALAAQERLLESSAVTELQMQKRRLANYAAQAQFALAALYDAAAGGTVK